MANVLCGVITITLAGKANKYVSDCAGEFKPTGEISMGRQLFINTNLQGLLSGVSVTILTVLQLVLSVDVHLICVQHLPD